MHINKRTEKTMKVSPENFAYLSDLKNSIRELTGLNASFNDVLAMVRHSFPTEQMVERLTIIAAEKRIKRNDNQ
ncbi:hypothetical protein [Rufibacter hautae]|uniref:Uncharacterized protein n=1 Tax=Rufibacter hautae TaxID=2595005 RepID=A0A5B6T9W0_9BACT|nr:hypothetical protein [Rufibacter hautae]KAA3436725.1 hypothetical protein FOA19_20315 [Rufibacter hautae]